MKGLYTILFILLFGIVLGNEADTLGVNETNDAKFVISKIEEIIRADTSFETTYEAQNYSKFKAKEVIERGGKLEEVYLLKLYHELLDEDDLIQRLPEKTKNFVIEYIVSKEKKNFKKWLNYRERSEMVRQSFFEVFKNYIRLDGRKLIWTESNEVVNSFDKLEKVSEEILSNTKE